MGQKQSSERLVYDHVKNGDDVNTIKALSRQGASLEWKDKEGKTPLTVAAKDGKLYNAAKTLIQLGANVNAFSKGHETPLHSAAEQGLEETVALLMSHGANPFLKNSKHQTPLDVARTKHCHTVVREIQGRISYFTGDIREVFGPGFSDSSAPELSSRVILVVVVPRSAPNPPSHPKLELVIYSNAQGTEARKILTLGKCKVKKPKFEQRCPALIILDKNTKTRYKFTSVTEGDKQQLRRLYNACKGISQVMPSSAPISLEPNTWNSPIRVPPWNNITINKSPTFIYNHGNNTTTPEYRETPNQSPLRADMYTGSNINNYNYGHHLGNNYSHVVQTPDSSPFSTLVPPTPSAPPMSRSSDDLLSPPAPLTQQGFADVNNDDTKLGNSGLCVVCWEAPVEGACVPCGHVSGCMSCLQVVKANNGFCPVCRSDIHQVVKLYSV